MKLREVVLSAVLACCLLMNATEQKSLSSSVSSKASADVILLPTPTGPYRVGRAGFHRVDASRPETFTADATDNRQVLFQIWYPAEPTGGTLAPYIDNLLPDNEIFRQSYTFAEIERVFKTRSRAFTGVKVSRAEKRYPVILFSHGLNRVSAHYTTLLENLASHGFIVVGVDSPFFSSALRMPDGRIVNNESQRNQRPGARVEEAVIQAQDLLFVLNELERLNKKDADVGLAGRFDLRHVGVFGHSRGGFTAPHACFLDSRFRACLNLDGYPLTPAVMANGIRQPYMHIEEIAPWLQNPPTDEELKRANQTREEANRQAQEVERQRAQTFSKMSSGVYVVTVKGAVHNSFSDMPIIVPERYSNLNINAARALTITNAYILAFFDRYLRGRHQRLLEGNAPKFPEVTLQVYRPRNHTTVREETLKAKFSLAIENSGTSQDLSSTAKFTKRIGYDDSDSTEGNHEKDFASNEFIIVPRGVEHRPFAEDECEALLFEPASTSTPATSRTNSRANSWKQFKARAHSVGYVIWRLSSTYEHTI